MGKVKFNGKDRTLKKSLTAYRRVDLTDEVCGFSSYISVLGIIHPLKTSYIQKRLEDSQQRLVTKKKTDYTRKIYDRGDEGQRLLSQLPLGSTLHTSRCNSEKNIALKAFKKRYQNRPQNNRNCLIVHIQILTFIPFLMLSFSDFYNANALIKKH